MTAVDVFFQEKARTFTKGQFGKFDKAMPVPCEVAMGTRAIVFTDHQQISDAMRRYRRHLVNNGYSYSSAHTEYQQSLDGGVTYALVRFSHFDHTGREIAHLDASYFVDLELPDRPVVQKVEFLDDPFCQALAPASQH